MKHNHDKTVKKKERKRKRRDSEKCVGPQNVNNIKCGERRLEGSLGIKLNWQKLRTEGLASSAILSSAHGIT